MYSVREPSICGKDAFMPAEKRLKKDRRYPFCAGGGSAFICGMRKLQNVIRNGAVPDREREIISRRKEYRPLVEAYW